MSLVSRGGLVALTSNSKIRGGLGRHGTTLHGVHAEGARGCGKERSHAGRQAVAKKMRGDVCMGRNVFVQEGGGEAWGVA